VFGGGKKTYPKERDRAHPSMINETTVILGQAILVIGLRGSSGEEERSSGGDRINFEEVVLNFRRAERHDH